LGPVFEKLSALCSGSDRSRQVLRAFSVDKAGCAGVCNASAGAQPRIRILAVTDAQMNPFRTMATALFGNASNEVAAWAAEQGVRLQLAATVKPHGPALVQAHGELLMALGDKSSFANSAFKNDAATLLLDITLAALADFGFVGTTGSTMSNHISSMSLSIADPRHVCEGLDADYAAAANQKHSCQSCGLSALDID
jgi:hypothetical protein